jgi:uncharacterized damage-inducible protein DinB
LKKREKLLRENAMNLYGPTQLATSIRTVRANTIAVADDIPKAHYGYRVTPESRSVEQILQHIIVNTQVTEHMHGQPDRIESFENLDFRALVNRLPVQERDRRSKSEIIALLKTEGDHFCQWIEQVPESVLAEPVHMPRGSNPETKNRFELVLGAKEHEMHHRAQPMVIQRLLGIVPHLTGSRQKTAESILGR